MKKKIIVFSGGLGNQMFQYAMALKLRLLGRKVNIDTSLYNLTKMHNGYELDRVFGIEESQVCRRGVHLFLLRILAKYHLPLFAVYDNLTYNPHVIESNNCYMFGYWQDERYFIDIKEEVCQKFIFKNIDERSLLIAKEMSEVNSVSVHFRRGDYISYGMTIVEIDYYRKAIDKINSLVENPYYYIFSDDPNEANKMAQTMAIKYKLIDHNKGKESYKDMFLMSQCKHNIIANSTFSWWGAWLNENEGKIVISPIYWDKNDLMFKPQPEDWISL